MVCSAVVIIEILCLGLFAWVRVGGRGVSVWKPFSSPTDLHGAIFLNDTYVLDMLEPSLDAWWDLGEHRKQCCCSCSLRLSLMLPYHSNYNGHRMLVLVFWSM